MRLGKDDRRNTDIKKAQITDKDIELLRKIMPNAASKLEETMVNEGTLPDRDAKRYRGHRKDKRPKQLA